jgi:hypothetical protein
LLGPQDWVHRDIVKDMMTGQEFYSRFENLVSEAKKDIKFNGVDTKVRLTSKAYLLLAQKAAGLKNAK